MGDLSLQAARLPRSLVVVRKSPLSRDYRDLRLPPSVYQQAVALLRNNLEFTVAASLRQEEFNSGTIVAFSHGFNRYVKSRWWIQQFKQLVTLKFMR
ncbi:calcium ion binding [Homalodisca vitripennis]|nr:calcium ion binding [Homalodisca vitripennis]